MYHGLLRSFVKIRFLSFVICVCFSFVVCTVQSSSPFFFPTHHVEPPSFVKKVDPSYLMLPGESARLHCKLKGSPVIQVTWFKNNKELSESNTVRMSFANSEAILDITDVKVDDSGTYSCEATNDAGSDSCSTEVVIKGLSAEPPALASLRTFAFLSFACNSQLTLCFVLL